MSCPHGEWNNEDCLICIKDEIIYDLTAKLQAAEDELAEWREHNPTPAGLLAERKRANDAEADRDSLSEKLGTLSDKLQAAEDELQAAEDDLQAAEAEVARMKEELTDARFHQHRWAEQYTEALERIAELGAELATEREAYREWYGKAGDDGAPATWDQLKRTATEAALRWADENRNLWITGNAFVAHGIAALLGEK